MQGPLRDTSRSEIKIVATTSPTFPRTPSLQNRFSGPASHIYSFKSQLDERIQVVYCRLLSVLPRADWHLGLENSSRDTSEVTRKAPTTASKPSLEAAKGFCGGGFTSAN
ncbi:MAG: hypothetical protein NVSMB9_13390 [Isosphaeraceae bacterium]